MGKSNSMQYRWNGNRKRQGLNKMIIGKKSVDNVDLLAVRIPVRLTSFNRLEFYFETKKLYSDMVAYPPRIYYLARTNLLSLYMKLAERYTVLFMYSLRPFYDITYFMFCTNHSYIKRFLNMCT